MYKDIVVNKPWGYEYLIYENENIGIWWLEIEPNTKTSLHCHPDKKTGLILLDGIAKIHFLSSNRILNSFDKVLIREGYFHSTENITNKNISVIEVETPKSKENLVRLEDSYGRKGMQYEKEQAFKERTDKELWIDDVIGTHIKYNKFVFSIDILTLELLELLNILVDEYFIILLSPIGIITRDNIPISRIGDVLTKKSITKLLTEFQINNDTKVMVINKEK